MVKKYYVYEQLPFQRGRNPHTFTPLENYQGKTDRIAIVLDESAKQVAEAQFANSRSFRTELGEVKELHNLSCSLMCLTCQESHILVNYLPFPFTGCYLKARCPNCGHETVLFNDYA